MSDLIDHDLQAGPRGTPVTVLTGFLGAGKTTLLNRILNGDHGLRVAVLVNDFGSINIDADLVVGVEGGGDIISLANGCVCCNIRDDLLAAVQQVIERPEQPEYIVLEASGVAEPSGIATTFMGPRLRDRIRLDSLMCVVDASQIFAAPEMMKLKLLQIAYADMLILNKADLVSRDEIARIRAWLDEHFHRYRLVESTRGEVPLEILLSAGRFDPAQLSAGQRLLSTEGNRGNKGMTAGISSLPSLASVKGRGSSQLRAGQQQPSAEGKRDNKESAFDFSPFPPVKSPDHSHAFSTWSYETDRPLSLETLREVARKLPASIYRCKGVIHSAESPDRRAVLQVVGKRVDVSLDSKWGKRVPRTQIVAIGAHGKVDDAALRKQFDACIAGFRPQPGSERVK